MARGALRWCEGRPQRPFPRPPTPQQSARLSAPTSWGSRAPLPTALEGQGQGLQVAPSKASLLGLWMWTATFSFSHMVCVLISSQGQPSRGIRTHPEDLALT